MTMNGISQVGQQISGENRPPMEGAPAEAQEKAEAQGDSVTISKDKSFLRKASEALIELPVKILEVGLSTTLGVTYAAKNAIPGALEGLSEGVKEHKGSRHAGWFTAGTIGEFVGGGAAIGMVMGGGPITAAIGAGIGLLSGLVVRGLEALTEADHTINNKIHENVDKAVSDNTEGTPIQIATRSATEGAIEGTVTGVATGYKLGSSLGKGLVAGLRGATDGIIEGIFGK
jgi:hypothetical protein